jgi:hypothetical protein
MKARAKEKKREITRHGLPERSFRKSWLPVWVGIGPENSPVLGYRLDCAGMEEEFIPAIFCWRPGF